VESSPLAAWENFYVIVGSSAAALTGLQFVVVALGAEKRAASGPELVLAFGTPTIVHFCAVLLIAAIVSAPWPSVVSAAFALNLCGAAGIAYTLIVVRRARGQTAYAPVLEDWLWHAVFPLIAYVALFVFSLVLAGDPAPCLFAIAAAALLLLFDGIHNAWDAVTYIATSQAVPKQKEAASKKE
jgi:hypothetical protein